MNGFYTLLSVCGAYGGRCSRWCTENGHGLDEARNPRIPRLFCYATLVSRRKWFSVYDLLFRFMIFYKDSTFENTYVDNKDIDVIIRET